MAHRSNIYLWNVAMQVLHKFTTAYHSGPYSLHLHQLKSSVADSMVAKERVKEGERELLVQWKTLFFEESRRMI